MSGGLKSSVNGCGNKHMRYRSSRRSDRDDGDGLVTLFAIQLTDYTTSLTLESRTGKGNRTTEKPMASRSGSRRQRKWTPLERLELECLAEFCLRLMLLYARRRRLCRLETFAVNMYLVVTKIKLEIFVVENTSTISIELSRTAGTTLHTPSVSQMPEGG